METDPETIPRDELDELDRWVFDDPWHDPEVQRDEDQPVNIRQTSHSAQRYLLY